ncbi:phage tail length tape measure family protein [Escherichia coli]|uniref:phage tail length tape measure family protein n=1 Tax=Escherichia coli TaxID=562 RepID=UPI001022067B|nr:phage tail length tape measure family protein [Escherichia coli]EFE7739091.1 phage tail protein [Escherichia coli]EFL9697144.1 phage tail protein [Escherichia coli]EGI4656024.1 phage tail protein [Escherichia coli]EHX1544972.1 phage tail length tape measure family protein [Escherichia coli]EIO6538168.1 phage tail length tape measure family protein [Escherichia coli]
MAEQQSRLAIIIDSTGAERNVDSLTAALGKMTGVGERAATAAGKVTKATDQEKQALSELLDRIDPVNAALNRLDKQQRDLARYKSKGMIDADTFAVYSKQIEDTRNKLTGFNDQLSRTGMTAKQTAANMRMVPAQMTDIVVSLASGQAPLTVLLQQGGQLKDMFGGIGPAAKALGSYVVGLINPFTLAAAAVGALGLAYYKGSQEQDEFNKSLTLTGNTVGKTAAQLSDIAASVSSTSKATTGASAAVLNQLVSSGKVAADSLEQVTRAVVTTSHATGIATDKLVDDFNKIAADPISAISDLNDKYHFLTVATYNQIKALQEQGNQQEATRLATETYANTMQQRSGEINQNLGLLEKGWNAITGATRRATDALLDFGRTDGPVQRIAEIRKELKFIDNAVGGDFFFGGRRKELQSELDGIQTQITTEDVISDAITKHNQAEQKRIKIQQEADRSGQQYLTNSDRRAKAIQQEAKFLEAGAITAEEYAKRLSRINEMYKDPEPPKARKEKAYAEDAATRLLDQINQQTAAMQSQLDASDKLNSATQARVKFEQQIADLKSKTQLTADQQSILARSQEILQAYKNQEALQNSVQTLDDYQKMQDQVKSKDEQTNDLLRERIALLEKAKATGKLKPGEYEQTRSNIYKNTPVELPSTVKSVIGNLTPTGGELSGTFNGLQNQYGQLDQAQQQLQAWLQAQEDAYSKAAQVTSEGEARMTAIRQQAAQANQAIEWQKYEIITSATQSFMDSGLQILSDGFGQQSAIYKAAFAASKAYAIAQSMVAINAGIAQAANGPFPANIIAMASVAAQTASIVSNIKAVADTGFMSGGYTGNGATRSISGVVHGQEYVFDAAATKRIGVSNLEAIRNGGLDATLSKPGFGTGNKNASSSGSSSQTNHISQVIHMPQSPGMTQQEMDAVLKLNNKQLVNELSAQTLEGKGQFGKSLRAAQGRGNRMT